MPFEQLPRIASPAMQTAHIDILDLPGHLAALLAAGTVVEFTQRGLALGHFVPAVQVFDLPVGGDGRFHSVRFEPQPPLQLRDGPVLYVSLSSAGRAVRDQVCRPIQAPTADVVLSLAARWTISADDCQRLVALVLDDLRRLHAGNFRRYPLRRSEYETWEALREMV